MRPNNETQTILRFWIGFGIIIYEMVFDRLEKPTLLWVAGALMGLSKLLDRLTPDSRDKKEE